MEFFPHTSDNRGGEEFFACHAPPIHQEILLLIHPPLFTHSPPWAVHIVCVRVNLSLTKCYTDRRLKLLYRLR
jgi:hypothetical protein